MTIATGLEFCGGVTDPLNKIDTYRDVTMWDFWWYVIVRKV